MSRVVHFEIHADNPERAADFYRRMFDWEITRWAGPTEYWLVSTGKPDEPGINGGIIRRMGPAPIEGQPVNAYVCTVGVTDLDAMLGQLPRLGAGLAAPKMAVPGIGWLAYGKDTEGNLFGMMQPDAAAR